MVVDAVAQPELVIIGAAECVHVAAVAQRERVMLACACHVDALSDPPPSCHVDALSDPPPVVRVHSDLITLIKDFD